MLESEADLVMLLNDDIEVSNFQGAIELFEKDESLFAVTFDYDCKGGGTVSPAFFANGGSSIYRRKIWNKLGGVDLIFEPAWWDDADLSQRARDAGYSILKDGRIITRTVRRLRGTQRLRLNPYHWYIQKRNYVIWVARYFPEAYQRVKTRWKWWPFVYMAERRIKEYEG